MNKQHKVFGITPSEPLQILRISIEQPLDGSKTTILQSGIKVVQLQATSTTFQTTEGPEVSTEIDYLTANGIFHNDELSGIGIPQEEDDIWCMDFNFISTIQSNTASLIIPTKRYPEANQARNNHHLQKVIDRFADGPYSLEMEKEKIIEILLDEFSEMTSNSVFPNKSKGNENAN